MDSILVATDFSDDARNAALRAAQLARDLGAARGVLLHVPPAVPFNIELELRATAALERALEALSGEIASETGYTLEPRIAGGSVVGAIAAEAPGHDLVVLGARGVNPLRDLAIGSSAERLVRKCPRPVLVVRTPPRGPYARIVVPVDFSPDSRSALALANRLSTAAAITLLHAYEVPFEGTLSIAGASEADIERYRSQARERAAVEMDVLAKAVGLPAGRSTRVIARAYPPQLIQHNVERMRADLVAIGKHGSSMAEELLLGSVTLHTLAAADCDVLVVPGAR